MAYRSVLAVSLLIITTGCPSKECEPGGPMTVSAMIDAKPYCAAVENVNVSAGNINVASSTDTMSVNFGFPDSGDTFTLGPNVALSFQVQTPSGTWTAAQTVGSGSLTVDLRTPSSASGTFKFVGQPLAGSSGSKAVDSGEFKITF